MTRRADVELRFTAKDLGTKSLDEINKLLDKVAQQQERLSSTSALAERSLQSFSQEASSLSAVLNALTQRKQAVEAFQQQGAAAQVLAQQVQQARERLEAFRKTQEEAGVSGRKLRESLAEPTRELRALEAQFASAERATERASKKLETFGVNVRSDAAVSRFGDEIAQSLGRAQSAITSNLQALDNQQDAQAKVNKQVVEYARLFDEVAEKERALQDQRRAAADLDTFRKVGADAADAAKSIDRATAAVDRFALRQQRSQRAQGTSRAVGDILAPDARQLASLRGLDTVLSEIENRVNQVTQGAEKNADKVRQLRGEYERFGESARRLNEIASLNDRLRQQTQELERTRQRYQEARQAVAGYAQQVQQAGVPNDALRASLERAQATLERLGPQYRRQADALLRTRQAAREAGLSVRDLDGNQQRLVSTAQRLTAQQDQVTRSMREMGVEVRRTGQGFSFLEDKGRKSLSLLQRIRGQVLALTASYVGLFGAINETRKILDAGVTFAGVEARLNVASGGDPKIFASELQFVRDTADRLGLELESVAITYSKFRAATAATNVSLEETRFIYEAVAEAGRTLRLDNEQVKGTFFALEQIFSKGKVQAEELRRQLGDRLPAAVATLAAGLGITTAEVDKLLDRGLLEADTILAFAAEYKKRVAGELPAATRSFEASLARLKNRVLELRLQVGRGGLLDEIQGLANELIDFFDSDAGKEFSRNLAEAFRTVARGLRIIVDNFQSIALGLKIILGFQVVRFFFGLGTAAIAAAANLGALSGAFTLLGKAIQRAVLIAAAAFAGFQLGKFLFEQSALVRRAGTEIAFAFTSIFNTFRIIYEEFAKTIESGFSALGKDLAVALVNNLLDTLQLLIRTVPGLPNFGVFKFVNPAREAVRQFLLDGIDKLRPEADRLENSITNVLRRIGERVTDETAAIREQYLDIFKLEEEARQRADKKGTDPEAEFNALVGDDQDIQRRVQEIQDRVQGLLGTGDDKEAARALKERERLLEQFAREQVRIETDLLNTQKDNLDARLKLIQIEAEERSRLLQQQEQALRDAGLKEQADALAERQQDLQILREINTETAIRAFNEERLKALQDQINQRLALQKDQIELINLTEKDRAVAAERIKELLRESNAEVGSLIDQAIALADALGEEGVVASLRRVKAGLAEVNDEGKRFADQFINIIAGEVTGFFKDFAGGIADAIRGVQSFGDVFQDIGRAIQGVLSNVLIKIGEVILEFLILRAIQQALGGSAGAFGNFISGRLGGTQLHSGGVVGATGARGGTPRTVSASWFAAAPRYHSGGVVGLKPGEVPAILQTGEEVLARSDPRNVVNGGAAGQTPQDIKIINAIDSRSVVTEGLNSPEGVKVLFNVIRANRSQFKQVLA